YKNKIKVVCVPGVSSITAALSVAGIKIDDFIFFSKIPRNKEERKIFFCRLRKIKEVKVFIDAPYRLANLLENIYYNLSNSANVVLCYELTTANEKVLRGKIKDIMSKAKSENLKGEFILIVD
nr:SAM-dependent methyltransferase [bacterium]